jgi:hypothetical protein
MYSRSAARITSIRHADRADQNGMGQSHRTRRRDRPPARLATYANHRIGWECGEDQIINGCCRSRVAADAEHNSHIRMQAKRDALQTVWKKQQKAEQQSKAEEMEDMQQCAPVSDFGTLKWAFSHIRCKSTEARHNEG